MALPWLIGAAAVALGAAALSGGKKGTSRESQLRALEEERRAEQRRAEKLEKERERKRIAAEKKAKETAALANIEVLLEENGMDSGKTKSFYNLVKAIGPDAAKAEFLKAWDDSQNNAEIQSLEQQLNTLNQLKQALRG